MQPVRLLSIAEYPGVHVEPPQPEEEEELWSICLGDGVGVVSPGQVPAGVKPKEPEGADCTVVPVMVMVACPNLSLL